MLHRAVQQGLLTEQELAAVGAKPTEAATPQRFGPRIDALLRAGKLSEAAVHRLIAADSPAATSGLEQTLDGRSAPVVAAAPPPAATSGLKQTLDGRSAPAVAAAPPPPSATSGLEQTLDGKSAPAVVAAPPAQNSPVPPKAAARPSLAQTLAGETDGIPGRAIVSVATFPVPHWDRYEFLELLGRGGMGAVYKARDRRLGRIVALKFIHGEDHAMVQRFQQEARAQARLDHPYICKVYEVGTVDNKPYIAMEYIDGDTLDIACKAMRLPQMLQVVKDAAAAMHAAHEQNVIHRDLKPSNIMIERQASGQLRPVVMDFGLARDSGTAGLTESGAVMGTPAYMSPEQARGEARRLDRRSDVYSLGATLYDVLTGQPPFHAETVVQILLQVMDKAAPPVRSHRSDLPEAVELIVSKCLNKEPAQRYPTALALADDLGRYLKAQQVVAQRLSYAYRLGYWARRKPALAALWGALLVSLLGLAGFGVRTRIVTLRREQQSRKETALAKSLGQAVKDLEWLVRTAYLLPLHDTSYEKGLVRERMAQITSELSSAGDAGARLGAYVLGRGHLALHEWDKAYEQLNRAKQLGYQDPELDYALGRVLGEKYSRAIELARKSGDKSFFEQRKKELEKEFLVDARAYLQRSRGLTTESPSYIEALLDYYNQYYDAALINAHLARRQSPWLYEAAKLEGDVHMARALDERDHGDNDQAERSFAAAIARYEEAATIGRSDYQVHEAIAEAWIRQEEMDMFRGRDPEKLMQKALAAADLAIEANSQESYGYTKKAFAIFLEAQYLQSHSAAQVAQNLYEKQIEIGNQAIILHPDDAYAYEIIGIAHCRTAEHLVNIRKSTDRAFGFAYKNLESALKINPKFPWAYNDIATTFNMSAIEKIAHNENPEQIL